MFKIIGKLILLLEKIHRKVSLTVFRRMFAKCGSNVIFDPTTSYFTYESIEIGSNVFIGGGAWWSTGPTKIVVGDYVMFGPGVKILGGDHATDRTDIPMYFQRKEDSLRKIDGDVIIEEDVWIGAGVTILKGVVIHKGAIIGAGSLVNKSVEAYSVVAGVPAKLIRSRLP